MRPGSSGLTTFCSMRKGVIQMARALRGKTVEYIKVRRRTSTSFRNDTHMNLRLALILIVLVATLAGCATLQGSVSRFHVLTTSPQAFVIIPIRDQQDSLEFKSYANLVRQALQARGWREGTLDAADVAIFFQYSISQGRQVAFSYPIFGQVPTGTSITTGTVSTFGNTSNIYATTTGQTTTGIVGSGLGSTTEFDRALRVLMFSLPAYRATQNMERVYEGEIRSSGSTGDLPTTMPVLIRGLFDDFPGASGTTRRVNVPVR